MTRLIEQRRRSTDGLQTRVYRAVGELETRVEKDDGSPDVAIGGTFANVNKDTFIGDGIGKLGGFYERLAPGAFREVVKTARPVLLNNHSGLALAKVPDTLQIFEKPNGDGGWRAQVDCRQSGAADLLVCLERKVITGTSYAFRLMPGDDSWSEDGNYRTIHKISGGIFDISPCQQPADDTTVTTIEGRSIYYADTMRGANTPRPRSGRMTTQELRMRYALDEIQKRRVDRFLQELGYRSDKYSTSQLKTLKGMGHTLPGTTSYPVHDEEDLKKAIKSVGRGNASHNAIRKYIMARAAAMKLSSLIPSNWQPDGSLK